MSRKFVIDAAERASMTFLQAFAAIVVVRSTVDWLTLKAAAVAGALAVAKAVAAKRIGDPDSAGISK